MGSAAAMFLAQHGLSVCLLERRPTASPHPRARGISVRTMELYRAAGIEPDIRLAGEDDFQFVLGDTLTGPHQPVPRIDAETMSRLSPTTPYSCDQNKVEPILRRRAEELGATIYFGSAATAIEQTDDDVTVLVETRSTPHDQQPQSAPPRRIWARYLVAADGANSKLRSKAGIGRHGRDVPGVGLSALFEADLDDALRGRHVSGLIAANHGAVLFPKGTVREHHWLGLTPRPEQENLDDDTASTAAISAIRSVVGDPTLAVHLCSVLTWKTGAYVADRYRDRRMFLVGDAAHIMPPYGGFGGNTGIADAHNLAWKLAAVCTGEAPDALLDTYERERLPIAEFTVDRVMNRGFGPRSAESTPVPPQQTAAHISLGDRYPTQGTEPTHRPYSDPTVSAVTPGMRAPHVRLREPAVSTLDLLDPRGFTFLTSDESGFAAALQSQTVRGVRACVVRQTDVLDVAAWEKLYANTATGGVLIRPDGIVGWCTDDAPPEPGAAVAAARARCLTYDDFPASRHIDIDGE
ncbi:MAG: FAD-dependent monooxygenase [Mycobacterium sp.]|nr:FAD-dependent monooxygenase [Mycobacterium sp.]